MVDINAHIRLRPIRIGFLVRPNDLASIQEAMRYCAAVWGGICNPIIPVFSTPPKVWASPPFDRVRGIGVAKGYIRFFEPDVYAEAEKGLLELVGLGAVRDRLTVYPDVVTLAELLRPEKHKDWSEPAFGLNIRDVQSHLYRTDQQFSKRDRRENIIVEAEKGSGVAELIFGVFPMEKSAGYIAQGYHETFQPTKLRANPASWEKVFKEHPVTPLKVTGYGLDNQRYWYHDAAIFVFDPRRPTDLIDAWNLRLEPHPVIPVPVDWFKALGDSIFDLLEASHRRIQGNPQNLMHNATIEFSRSVPKSCAESLIETLKPGLAPGALVVKNWRNRIWVDHRDEEYVHRDRRMIVTASERGAKLQIDEAAISGALERIGIKAKLSEPGHIAKQMLDHLGGLWGVYLLADIETMILLNKMAGGLRKRSTETRTVEESFELRAAPLKDWIDLLARRKQTQRLPEANLDHFTSKNVIRLGLETDCPHCQAKNWTGLNAVGYEVSCQRCLKVYPFPQGQLRDQNRNWCYRVVGPFSVPDYGRGAYGALLRLRLIDRFNSSFDEMTFATAMTLSFDSRQVEVDFLALRRVERNGLAVAPEIVLGEAKSVGKGQLIKPRDLTQLKAVAAKLPGAIIVISVLRDHFLPIEKRILEALC